MIESSNLMKIKNHDYGAWRDMRVSSLTDLILQKLFRVKQIEDNKGETLISEGVDANYFDIINYAIFALIKQNNMNYLTYFSRYFVGIIYCLASKSKYVLGFSYKLEEYFAPCVVY